MLIRRQAFLRVGLFNTDRKMAEFADWYLRAMELGLNKVMLPDLLVWRRLHRANNGLQQSKHLKDYLYFFKKSIDRRRAAELQRED